MNSRRRQSVLARLVCLCAGLLLIWPLTSWEISPRLVVESSPLVTVSAAITKRAIGLTACTGLCFAILSMIRKRWYCRYICPTGLVLEALALTRQRRSASWSRWPPLGQYTAALTLAGAVIGYPVLLWLDPMAIFGSPFAIAVSGDLHSGLLAGSVLWILLIMTLVLGGVWCGRLCPLGGFQDQLAAVSATLARGLFDFRTRWLASMRHRRKMFRSRRAVMGAMLGAGMGWLGKTDGLARAASDVAPLRPPGAVSEERFAGVCVRCGNCTAACPVHIIRPDISGQTGIAGLLAPTIRYDAGDYCREDCSLCTQVCPSGALQALELPEKQRYIIGAALVDVSICLLALGRKECDACAAACPYAAIEILWDENVYVSYPGVIPGRCNGCGACEIACPTVPLKSISVWTVLPHTAVTGRIIEAPRFLSNP